MQDRFLFAIGIDNTTNLGAPLERELLKYFDPSEFDIVAVANKERAKNADDVRDVAQGVLDATVDCCEAHLYFGLTSAYITKTEAFGTFFVQFTAIAAVHEYGRYQEEDIVFNDYLGGLPNGHIPRHKGPNVLDHIVTFVAQELNYRLPLSKTL